MKPLTFSVVMKSGYGEIPVSVRASNRDSLLKKAKTAVRKLGHKLVEIRLGDKVVYKNGWHDSNLILIGWGNN